MALDPYARTTRRSGVVLNLRTLEMLEVTELRELRAITPLPLSQGSYTSAAAQSAGTHSGGGALDVKLSEVPRDEWWHIVGALRRTGFAAWLRDPSQGDWPYHIHAIAIGDREMSDAAARQVAAYKEGRNGLANNGLDVGPRVPYTIYRQDIDMSYYGPEHWDADDWRKIEDKIIDRVFEVVWKRDGAIRNQNQPALIDGKPNAAAYGPANWFVSDIENTQDADHDTLTAIGETVAAIAAKVGIVPPA